MPKREASEETKTVDTLILVMQFPEIWENKFLLFKPPCLWYLFWQSQQTSTVTVQMSYAPEFYGPLYCRGEAPNQAQALKIWQKRGSLDGNEDRDYHKRNALPTLQSSSSHRSPGEKSRQRPKGLCSRSTVGSPRSMSGFLICLSFSHPIGKLELTMWASQNNSQG